MQTRSRSHSADITADHLGDAYKKWCADITADHLGDAYKKWCAELDMIGQLIHALQQIAKGER